MENTRQNRQELCDCNAGLSDIARRFTRLASGGGEWAGDDDLRSYADALIDLRLSVSRLIDRFVTSRATMAHLAAEFKASG